MSSIFRLTDSVVINPASPIPIDTDLLITPPKIKKGALVPGKGGHVRIWIAVTTVGGADTSLKVFKTNPVGTLPLVTEEGFVNADNNFIIKSKGIYWFDISVTEETIINIQSTTSPDGATAGVGITSIDLLDIQKIVFGA